MHTTELVSSLFVTRKSHSSPSPHHPFLWLFFMKLPLPFLQWRFWKMLSKKRGVTSENSTAFPFSLSQKQEPPYFRLHSDPLSLDNKVAGTEPINSHVLLPASQRQNISYNRYNHGHFEDQSHRHSRFREKFACHFWSSRFLGKKSSAPLAPPSSLFFFTVLYF